MPEAQTAPEPPAPFRSATGVVTAFDDHRGDGTVTAADGTPLTFHCTQIADGTRTIITGTSVRFLVRPGRLGRWEAADIRPV
jgi:cold shock CspA family protein